MISGKALNRRGAPSSSLSFIDSTPLVVCHNRHIPQCRTFAGIAQRGHNSADWFFDFKLHLIVNDRGEVLACLPSSGACWASGSATIATYRLILLGDRVLLRRAILSRFTTS